MAGPARGDRRASHRVLDFAPSLSLPSAAATERDSLITRGGGAVCVSVGARDSTASK